MARPRNHVIYNSDQDELKRLAEEYQMLGRDIDLTPGKLVVYALPKRKKVVKQKQSLKR